MVSRLDGGAKKDFEGDFFHIYVWVSNIETHLKSVAHGHMNDCSYIIY
jgi:hypothetical protein